MKVPKTLDDVKLLIDNRVEEGFHLEYKSAEGIKNNGKIAKEVSAMANAAGGIIIYGIKEFDDKDKNHLPEKITPIKIKSFSKEKLEQIIMDNVSPKLQGLLIHPIPLDKEENEVVYVVEIPQSVTAHQNTVDHKYYIRGNFQCVPMLDYQIRDIMNRRKHPQVELIFEIEKVISLEESRIMGEGDSIAAKLLSGTTTEEEKTTTTLKVTPINNGSVVAEYINYFIQLPDEIFDHNERDYLPETEDGIREYYGENTVRDILNENSHNSGYYGPSRFHPLLPKMAAESKNIILKNEDFGNSEITWTVYADNAEPISNKIQLKDILITTVDKREE